MLDVVNSFATGFVVDNISHISVGFIGILSFKAISALRRVSKSRRLRVFAAEVLKALAEVVSPAGVKKDPKLIFLCHRNINV